MQGDDNIIQCTYCIVCSEFCRCVCDLAVGSLALQDPPGAHVTFSARQELSGWQAPAAGSEEEEQSRFTAAGTRPRLFVVFEDGSGYEVLDQDLFTAYAQRKVDTKPVHGLSHACCLS